MTDLVYRRALADGQAMAGTPAAALYVSGATESPLPPDRAAMGIDA